MHCLISKSREVMTQELKKYIFKITILISKHNVYIKNKLKLATVIHRWSEHLQLTKSIIS